MSRAARWLLVGAALAAAGCPRSGEEAPAKGSAEERTLAKLKEEVARNPPAMGSARAPAGPPTEDPNASLARLASDQPATPATLGLPAKNGPVKVGAVQAQLTGLSTSHTVTGGKLTLSSEDLFLRVQLQLENGSAEPAPLDFAYVQVKREGAEEPVPVARDAQRAAGTKVLNAPLAAHEKRELVLYFELPLSADGLKGYTLVVPAAVGGNEDVAVPLG